MKAAVYYGQKDVKLVDLPLPPVGDNDVLLQNLTAGICGTDVQAWLHGPRAHKLKPGSEFGHEVVCRVVAMGRNVEGLEIGSASIPIPCSRVATRHVLAHWAAFPNSSSAPIAM